MSKRKFKRTNKTNKRPKKRVHGSGSFSQADVLCPFYKRDNGKTRVVCEGIVDHSSIVLTFGSPTQCRRQLEIFCCDHYRNCEVNRMLMEKYED